MITIVAHRGAPKHAHENTIESFLAAITLGADMIELGCPEMRGWNARHIS